MSSHYKALVVVFAISLLVLFFFRKPYAEIIGSKRYRNWAFLWLSITASAFIINGFWLFTGVSAVLVYAFSRAEPVKPAIYALLIAATPAFDVPMRGFAGINMFIDVSPQLVVAAVILIPALFNARKIKKIARAANGADLFFLLFLLLELALAARAESFTHMLRTGVQAALLMAPLYYVFSRYPKTLDDVRIISTAFVLSVMIMAVISILEIILSWHLYDGVIRNWFGQVPFGYKLRGGFLRASVSAFNPIVWGFVAMSAIGLAIAVLNDGFSKYYRNIGFVVLAAGLLTCLSRGPWVGAIIVFIVFVLSSRQAFTRALQLSLGLLIATGIASMTSFGRSVLEFLPYFGTSGGDTISYRQRLLDASLQVIMENPFFGTLNYLAHPKLQAMRQGEGIIDLVNVYIQIALSSGLVGVSLFIGVFLSVLLPLRKAMISARKYNPKLALYCQVYLATIVGIMATIFTTSQIGQIPIIYWAFLGIGVALARIEEVQRTTPRVNAPSSEEPAPADRFAWK